MCLSYKHIKLSHLTPTPSLEADLIAPILQSCRLRLGEVSTTCLQTRGLAGHPRPGSHQVTKPPLLSLRLKPPRTRHLKAHTPWHTPAAHLLLFLQVLQRWLGSNHHIRESGSMQRSLISGVTLDMSPEVSAKVLSHL